MLPSKDDIVEPEPTNRQSELIVGSVRELFKASPKLVSQHASDPALERHGSCGRLAIVIEPTLDRREGIGDGIIDRKDIDRIGRQKTKATSGVVAQRAVEPDTTRQFRELRKNYLRSCPRR